MRRKTGVPGTESQVPHNEVTTLLNYCRIQIFNSGMKTGGESKIPPPLTSTAATWRRGEGGNTTLGR